MRLRALLTAVMRVIRTRQTQIGQRSHIRRLIALPPRLLEHDAVIEIPSDNRRPAREKVAIVIQRPQQQPPLRRILVADDAAPPLR